MPEKSARSNAASASRTRAADLSDDDAPEITDAMLDGAEIVRRGKVIQRGRPPLGTRPKQSVTLRLDADVVDAFRATGSGWQSRINDALVKSAKRLKRV